MMFVSVGTHEQGFDRLIKELDRLKGEGLYSGEIFIQLGYTRYVPKYCKYAKMISYDEMKARIIESHIYVTHGGPGSIFLGWQCNKIPIVAPRMKKFNEHVDNHQVNFTKRLEAIGRIIAVYDIADLQEKFFNYDNLIQGIDVESFCQNNRLPLLNKLTAYCEELNSNH